MNDEMIKDVDEALKQEKYQELWSKYGAYLIGAIVAIVLGTAAVSGYDYYKTQQQEAQTKAALESLSIGQNEPLTAEQQITEIRNDLESLSGQFKTLMSLQLANALLSNGQTDDALSVYNDISGDQGARQPYRDLATISSIRIRMDQVTGYDGLLEEIDPLTEEGRPFMYSARELKGMFLQNTGKIVEGNRVLQKLTMDADAPSTIRERARAMIVNIDNSQN